MAVAESTSVDARRSHQRHVAALLDEIENLRQQVYVRQAAGVRAAGMRNLKTALQAAREELAAVIDAAGSFAADLPLARR
jgi:hypothetical protein